MTSYHKARSLAAILNRAERDGEKLPKLSPCDYLEILPWEVYKQGKVYRVRKIIFPVWIEICSNLK